MRSPFPGMDPFIEAYRLWEDFHYRLIYEIDRAIVEKLPSRYVSRIGERYYLDAIDPNGGRSPERSFVSDVSLDAARSPSTSQLPPASAATVTAGAVAMRGQFSEEHRETFLEIRDLDRGRRLVTTIEVLSPTNKRPGEEGWQQYEEKRRVFLRGHAHLVEIDLLRGGQRHAMAQPWPPGPYYALVLRADEAPECLVWPAHSLQPLPTIPIPLLLPDPDLHLALQPLVDAIYARSRYFVDIDYRQPRRLQLTSEETAWLQQQLPPPANGPAPS